MTTVLPRAVMWHYVRAAGATPPSAYHGVTPAVFARQLDTIARDHLPIDWPMLRSALAGGASLPSDAVILTFDDGLVDHHRTVLPALIERGLQGVFFVLAREPRDGLTLGHRLHVLRAVWTADRIRDALLDRLPEAAAASYRHAMAIATDDDPADPDDVWKRPLQRELADAAGPILSTLVDEVVGPEADVAASLYLSPSQLDDLERAGMTLGGHTRTHPWLDALDADARRDEVAASARALERRADGPLPFAYPYGAVPEDAGELLASQGFGAAFTTDPAERQDRFRIGRVDGDDPNWASQLTGPTPTGEQA